jgi:hypothetical protein
MVFVINIVNVVTSGHEQLPERELKDNKKKENNVRAQSEEQPQCLVLRHCNILHEMVPSYSSNVPSASRNAMSKRTYMSEI